MSTTRMTSLMRSFRADFTRVAAFFALSLCSVTACTAPPPGDENTTDTPGTGGGGGGNPPVPGSGGAAPILPSTPPENPDTCEASVPGSRLLRRLTQRELTNTQLDIFGEAASTATTNLPGDAVDRTRLSNDSAILQMSQDVAIAVLDRAEEIATHVTSAGNLPTNLPCAASAPDAACATEFIQNYGDALFRRPLLPADIDRYLALHQSVSGESDFSTGLKWTLVALIQSPHAVYRTELGEGGKLTPYEIASELSYSYSASPPSADLIARALNGEFDDPQARFQEAKSLLTTTPRGLDVLRQFFEEWLTYRDVLTVSRAQTPDNFEQMRTKMVKETERFLETLLLENNGKLSDLLTANYTVADQDLAAYYGFEGGTGDILTDGGAQVERTFGLGVFAQGSVTATMSSITITSPTRRGLLLLRRLYCQVPGLPQAINFDLTSDEVVGNTTRERLENSHLKDGCSTCHQAFDPLGFGFEHFDHVGRYREEELTPNGSFPIDATATVALLDNLVIDGQEQLMTGLAADPAVLACVSGTMSRYVYGGQEACRDKVARTRVMAGDTSIVDYLAELAREPHFIERTLD